MSFIDAAGSDAVGNGQKAVQIPGFVGSVAFILGKKFSKVLENIRGIPSWRFPLGLVCDRQLRQLWSIFPRKLQSGVAALKGVENEANLFWAMVA